MIVLGAMERLEGHHLRDQRSTQTPDAFSAAIFSSATSLLLRRVIKDHRAILRAGVGALAIERCRIVNVEEDIEQFAEREDGGIEDDLHYLGVSGGAGADLLVSRIGDTLPPA